MPLDLPSKKATQRLIFQNRYKQVASDLYKSTEASKYFKSTDDEEELPTDDVDGGFQNRLNQTVVYH